MKSSCKRQITRCLLALGTVLIAGVVVYAMVRDNIHVVQDQAVYRSAQLSSSKLEKVVRRYHIQTIVNLRGENHAPWYQHEKQLADSLGVSLWDYRLSGLRMPRREEVAGLVEVLEDAPRPVLLHCRSGADRTGLASALSMIQAGQGEQAASQVGWRYGAWHQQSAGRLFMNAFTTWAYEHGEPLSWEALKIWLDDDELSE